ncbi:MAG: exodeoxyribonuclease VII large subunit [Bacteroidales bacterium]
MSLPEHLNLSTLLQRIKSTISQELEHSYWIVAEISDSNINYRGHCYMELIEKPEHADNIIAKQRATIWARNYTMISSYFESVTGTTLQKGIRILCRVSVEFHALYGLSLNIIDIEPVFTIGEDEKRRQEIVRRLENEGIAYLNREIELPEVIQKIAIISSPTAAGYEDFMQQLNNNSYNFIFYTCLFQASMQGQEVEKSITSALERIYEHEDSFDAVVIIRGGGAKTDLRWFDSYILAAHIAQFPLPVISGIGHDKDMSIVDMVSHTSLKTPTAVANFIIDYASEMYSHIEKLQADLHTVVSEYFSRKELEFQQLNSTFIHTTKKAVSEETYTLQKMAQLVSTHSRASLYRALSTCSTLSYKLSAEKNAYIQHKHDNLLTLSHHFSHTVPAFFTYHTHKLELFTSHIQSHNPEHILKQGYSITHNKQGKRLFSATSVQNNDILYTQLADGTIISKVYT